MSPWKPQFDSMHPCAPMARSAQFAEVAEDLVRARTGFCINLLGVTLECIALEVGVTSDQRAQQRAFDSFRGTYNTERPHAALGLVPPAAMHRRSSCHYPRGLLPTGDTPGHAEHVDRRGWLRWRPRNVFLGEALALERVSLWPGERSRFCPSPSWQGADATLTHR